MRRLLLTLAAALLAAAPARAVEWVPVFDSSLQLGQLYENGSASSWQGNASLQATPAAKLDERWGVIPTYAFDYRGTKSVTDLGSGGQLFQDSMSHALLVKGIWKDGPLKLKPKAGYRWELLRETRGESWGGGLFDYRKPSAGLDAEYDFGGGRVASASFDWYKILFPNYSSLESAVVGQGLGREQAQARTLDSDNLSWTLSGSAPTPVPEVKAKLSANWTARSYGQQHLVAASGDLTPDTRRDDAVSVDGALFWGRRLTENAGIFLSLEGGWTRLTSDQNHYDASLSVFNPDYYAYEERRIGPRATAILGPRRVELSFSYLNVCRRYLSRPAQDVSGAYTSDAESLNQDNFTFDLAVPVNEHWKVLAAADIATASSNQKYELFFRTNYTLQSYLLGVSFSY